MVVDAAEDVVEEDVVEEDFAGEDVVEEDVAVVVVLVPSEDPTVISAEPVL